MYAVVRQLAKVCLEFIAPPICEACGVRILAKKGAVLPLCPQCMLQVQQIQRSVLPELRKRFPAPCAVDDCFALYWYTGPVPSVIYALKYRFRRRLAVQLGVLLGQLLREQGKVSVDAVVPVPLHPARKRERGYNQAAFIAQGVAATFGVPLETHWIRRRRWTPSQTQLADAERLRNVRDAFAAGKMAAAAEGKAVVLVDDVVTTGATLCACAQVLRHCRVRSIVGAALALPPR